jgi:hypothetical protein
MSDFIDDVRGIVEDTIIEGIYDNFGERDGDVFIKNLDSELTDPELFQAIEDLYELVQDKIDELVEKKESDDDDD